MCPLSSENSRRFSRSRTRLFVVRTPWMDSLKLAVICELNFRISRELSSIFFWKYLETTASGGRMPRTMSASLQFMMRRLAAIITM